jgi:hypothetical protein
MNIDKSKCFTYNGWVMTLYNEPLGSLFHECDDKTLGITACVVMTPEGAGFSAYCIRCYASMPADYSKVLMAMWNLNRKL